MSLSRELKRPGLECWVGKKRSWPNRDTIQASAWRNEPQSRHPYLRTKHLLNTNLRRYRYANLLGENEFITCSRSLPSPYRTLPQNPVTVPSLLLTVWSTEITQRLNILVTENVSSISLWRFSLPRLLSSVCRPFPSMGQFPRNVMPLTIPPIFSSSVHCTSSLTLHTPWDRFALEPTKPKRLAHC